MADDVIDNTGEAAELATLEPEQGAADIPAPVSVTPQDWRENLPESLRGAVGDMQDAEAITEALKRGLSHVPLASAQDVKITAPDGAVLDDADLGWFKDLAVQNGMSQGQVDALVNGYNGFAEQIKAIQLATTETALKAEYGTRYAEVMAKANDTCRKFNEMTDGGLSGVLEAGLGNHPGFIKFMIALSESVSDSSLPGLPKGGAETAMSTADFLGDIFKQGAAGA